MKRPRTLLGWTFLTTAALLTLCPGTLIAADQTLCLSRDTEVARPVESRKGKESERRAQISISHDARPYAIEIQASNRIAITRVNLNAVETLSAIDAPQIGHGWVERIELRPDGWVWVDGQERDYVAWVKRDGSTPALTAPLALAKLKKTRCNAWTKLSAGCPPAQSYFSKTLERVFVSGYPDSVFGQSAAVSSELDGDKRTPLRVPIDLGRLVVELPRLGGVLFSGYKGEAIFYSPSGEQVLPLPTSLLDRWMAFELDTSGRIFISGFNAPVPFLSELLLGGKLRVLRMTGVPSGWRLLADHPARDGVLGIGRQGIEAEVDGVWRTIGFVTGDAYIEGPMGVSRNSKGDWSFDVSIPSTGTSTRYSLHPKRDSRCDVKLPEIDPVRIPI